jgi:NADH:ubiquinone oxidoreductase subunit 2 (subunit N)
MVSAVISAFLYLKIVITMYAVDEDTAPAVGAPRLVVPWGTRLGLVLAFVFVVGVGIVPGPITNLAHHAVPRLIAVAAK